MAGGAVIQLPSSFASFDDPTSAADIDRFVRWPNADAIDRVKLLKLAWDAIGSEFAGRHQQYEMFYAGDPSVVNMREFREYRWPLAVDLIDRTLERTSRTGMQRSGATQAGPSPSQAAADELRPGGLRQARARVRRPDRCGRRLRVGAGRRRRHRTARRDDPVRLARVRAG